MHHSSMFGSVSYGGIATQCFPGPGENGRWVEGTGPVVVTGHGLAVVTGPGSVVVTGTGPVADSGPGAEVVCKRWSSWTWWWNVAFQGLFH